MEAAPGMQLLHAGLRTFLLSLLLAWPTAGQFNVIGPHSPVITEVGAEAVFSCHLSPARDAQHMEVRWFQESHPGLVYYYRDSQDDLEQQRPEYRGRTEFLRENITRGQVALRIRPMHPTDGGDYKCSFASSSEYNEAQFKVEVTALGLAPHIHVEPGNTGSIKLTCTSKAWYPEPEVQWSGPGKLYLEPDSEIRAVEGNSLFRVESSLTVTESSSEDVSCSIRNPVLHVEKEAHVSMAGGLFPRVNVMIVMLAVFLTLLAVGLVYTVFIFLRTRKNKAENWKKYAELWREYESLQKDCADIGERNAKISKELEERRFLGEKGLKEFREFAEDITLDLDTAHPSLEVSADRKSVKSVITKKDVPNNPERFDTMPAVLGQNSFSSGKHYWEVDVAGDKKWRVGLCVESLNRKGEYNSAKPHSGLWTLCQRNRRSMRLPVPYQKEILCASGAVLRLGIFLDYEEGLIAFYNVTQGTILHTFKTKFTEPLRPYFYPEPAVEENTNLKITNGLTIVQVPRAPGRAAS